MRLTLALVAGLVLAGATNAEDKGAKKVSPVLNFKMKGIDGKEVDLSQYQGKVVLFVNVASQCGLTPQYKGLQALHDQYSKDGLVIVGVPANEFGEQEPGTDDEIQKFCQTKYSVSFPMLSKVVVKGTGICPLYKFLTSKETNGTFAGEITWNFEKFLVNRKGEVVARFAPRIAPDSAEVRDAIKAELEKK
jgi:glutathione peroxidase